MKFIKNTAYLFCLLLLMSCVEKLDFNQAEDYVLTPVYSSALAYFTVLPIHFFDETGTVQQTKISDISGFRVFESSILKNNLIKLDYQVEIKNEIDKDFIINIEFFDDNNTSTYKFSPLNIDANNLNYTYLEEIDVRINSTIKNTTKVKIEAEIKNPNPPLNPNDNSAFEFKSGVTLYIEKSF